MADSNSDSSAADRHLRIPIRTRYWQRPERMHRANTGEKIDCVAGVGVSKVRRGSASLRQYSGHQLSGPGRQVPLLQGYDFVDVPSGGIAQRAALPGVLSDIWTYSGRAEMGCVLLA